MEREENGMNERKEKEEEKDLKEEEGRIEGEILAEEKKEE